MNFNCDQRLHGTTSRERQSRHADILAVRMQFMTMKSDAENVKKMFVCEGGMA